MMTTLFTHPQREPAGATQEQLGVDSPSKISSGSTPPSSAIRERKSTPNGILSPSDSSYATLPAVTVEQLRIENSVDGSPVGPD
jgi:hypothetical protein